MSLAGRITCRLTRPTLLVPLAALAAALSGLPLPAVAESASAPAPQESVTEELIRRLVQHNALSKDDAERLIERLQTEPAQQPHEPAAPQQPAAAEGASPSAGAPPSENKGRVRVIYLPESEKEQIRAQLKQDVIATAKAENWAQPNALPEWVKRISLDGDFRLRQEYDYFDSKNYSQFLNFQTMNSGAPVDINQDLLQLPYLNTTQNRELLRVRGRLGLSAEVADDLTAGFRFATGNTTNPVSTNQTLGTDFNKVTFVIDRAYLNYRPVRDLSIWGGRMPNPWLSTELVWDDDLNFDGIAAHYRYSLSQHWTPFVTLGAFSVENTAFDFPTAGPTKYASRDKWLFAAQLGANWKASADLSVGGALAYYDFYHLEGQISEPCLASSATVSCSSDDSRPGFIQKGNTLIELRNLELLTGSNTAQYQYFGLASPFRIVDATLKLDYRLKGALHLGIDADYANNLAFRRSKVEALGPVNNFGPDSTYQSGSVAYLGQIRFGYPQISERGNWNVAGGYRHLDPDAVVDAFTDSDFHLGGTNAKGYYVGANLGFTHNAWLSAHWLSAREVFGVPLAIDLLQLDVNARF